MKVFSSILYKIYSIKIIFTALLLSLSTDVIGDTTVFTPLEGEVATPPSLSIKIDGNNYLLTWDSSSATYYKLELLVNDAWISINDEILTNTYTVPLSSGNELRVSSCNAIGCSDWRQINNVITGELMINRFSKSGDAVVEGQDVLLSWDVNSASNITISSNKDHFYSTYISQGTQAFTVNELTRFTLTATSFEQTYSQQIMVSPVAVIPDFSSGTDIDANDQPLQQYVLAQNQQMLPVERALLSVALSDGSKLTIIPQQDNKLSSVSDDGLELWTINLDGIVANLPVFKTTETEGINYLFFNVSSVDGYGQLCRLTIDEADITSDDLDVQCFTKKPNSEEMLSSLISSPVLVEDRVFAFSVDGGMYEVSTEFTSASYIQHGQISLDTSDAILTTPLIDTRTDSIIIRTKQNNVMSLLIPAAQGAVNTLVKQAKTFFGFVSKSSVLISSISSVLTSTVSSDSSSEEIVIKWKKSLSQEEGK